MKSFARYIDFLEDKKLLQKCFLKPLVNHTLANIPLTLNKNDRSPWNAFFLVNCIELSL